MIRGFKYELYVEEKQKEQNDYFLKLNIEEVLKDFELWLEKENFMKDDSI